MVLEPKSRAAHRVANRTPTAIEGRIVAKRKRLIDAGLDAGAGIDRFISVACEAGLPSEATIWRILKARGFIVADPSKRPKRADRRFSAERANECWQLDDTTWELADGTDVKILNVIDDHSRLLVASHSDGDVHRGRHTGGARPAATMLGWPARFLSDNAKAFRNVLADALAAYRRRPGHSRPYHPQTNGKVERFHQTLKRGSPANPRRDPRRAPSPARPVPAIYNHHRPHRAIGAALPRRRLGHAPKSGPADRPLGTTHPHSGKPPSPAAASASATATAISVGAAHNDRPALAILTGTTCHVFADGRLIRRLPSTPTANHSPSTTNPEDPANYRDRNPTPTQRDAPRHPRGMPRDTTVSSGRLDHRRNAVRGSGRPARQFWPSRRPLP